MQSAEDADTETTPASRLAALERVGGTATEILALFDSLPPVPTKALHGRWRGSGLPSGHSMDGLLERFGCYGKEFNGPEDVQPLLCKGRSGKTFGLNAAFVPHGPGEPARRPVPQPVRRGGVRVVRTGGQDDAADSVPDDDGVPRRGDRDDDLRLLAHTGRVPRGSATRVAWRHGPARHGATVLL